MLRNVLPLKWMLLLWMVCIRYTVEEYKTDVEYEAPSIPTNYMFLSIFIVHFVNRVLLCIIGEWLSVLDDGQQIIFAFTNEIQIRELSCGKDKAYYKIKTIWHH